MQHEDHVRLLQNGVAARGGVWADLGSGGGAFTLAIADLLGPTATIHSIDKDRGSLREQERAMRARFPDANVQYTVADFTKPLDLPPLDGLVMANSLHYVRGKPPVLALVRRYLKPGGRLLLVEYNADHGNMWVPYPMSYPTWERIATLAGFLQTRLIARTPSRFLDEIYAAASDNPA